MEERENRAVHGGLVITALHPRRPATSSPGRIDQRSSNAAQQLGLNSVTTAIGSLAARLPAFNECRPSLRDYCRKLPERLSGEEERELRRRELDLRIDHRLGRDFPAERREALWAVAQRVERRRPLLLARHLLRRLWPMGLERGAAELADYMIDEYAKVLAPAELEAFFKDDAEG